jgi:hypothetical protein
MFLFLNTLKSLFPLKNLLFGKSPIVNTGTSLKSGNTEAKFIGSNCLTFDGVDDRIGLANKISYFDDTANPWTIEFPVFHINNTNTEMYISNYGPEVQGFYLARAATSGKMVLMLRKVATTDSLNFSWTNPVPNNQWVRVRITYNGNKRANGCKLYFDGVEQVAKESVTETLSSNFLVTTALTTTIGTYQTSSTPTYASFFLGSMAYMKACSVVLNGTEEMTNADILNIDFSVGTGTLIFDKRTGQKNNATMVNFTQPTCWATRTQNLHHHNISKGFSNYLKGNKTNTALTINESRFKDFGTNNFWVKVNFFMHTAVATTNEVLFGIYKNETVSNRIALFLGTTGVLHCFIAFGATSFSIPAGAIVSTGSRKEVLINVNRTGNMDVYLNGTLYGTVNISSLSSTPFTTTYLFSMFKGIDVTNADFLFCNQSISEVAMGYGLAPVDGSTDNLTPDICHFVTSPYNSTVLDLVAKTNYAVANGTIQRFPIGADMINDAIGSPVITPAGSFHNGAETNIDFTNGGVNTSIPITYNNVVFNSVLTNPFFYRKIKQAGFAIRNDRYLIYATTQVGSALNKINKYIQDKIL